MAYSKSQKHSLVNRPVYKQDLIFNSKKLNKKFSSSKIRSRQNLQNQVILGSEKNEVLENNIKNSSSFASDKNPKIDNHKFYGGLDLQYNAISYDSNNPSLADGSIAYEMSEKILPTYLINPNFFIGFDDQKNLKIELNYGFGNANKINNATGFGANAQGQIGQYSARYPFTYKTKSNLEFSYLGLDFKPYTKLDEVTNFFVLLGIGRYDFSLKEESYYQVNSVEKHNSSTSSLSKIAPSVGFGLEFRFFEPIFARAQFRYSGLNARIQGSELVGEVTIQNIISSNVGIGYVF